jgi:hypothetical protein
MIMAYQDDARHMARGMNVAWSDVVDYAQAVQDVLKTAKRAGDGQTVRRASGILKKLRVAGVALRSVESELNKIAQSR